MTPSGKLPFLWWLATGFVLPADARPTNSSTAAGRCVPDPESTKIGDRATCTFVSLIDFDEQRIPAKIPKVACKCPFIPCQKLGDYRCQEVKEVITVSYANGNSVSELKNKTITVTVACVCATSRGLQSAWSPQRMIG